MFTHEWSTFIGMYYALLCRPLTSGPISNASSMHQDTSVYRLNAMILAVDRIVSVAFQRPTIRYVLKFTLLCIHGNP